MLLFLFIWLSSLAWHYRKAICKVGKILQTDKRFVGKHPLPNEKSFKKKQLRCKRYAEQPVPLLSAEGVCITTVACFEPPQENLFQS